MGSKLSFLKGHCKLSSQGRGWYLESEGGEGVIAGVPQGGVISPHCSMCLSTTLMTAVPRDL